MGILTMCHGEFNLGSSCWQRILVDGLNLLFLIIYCLSLIVSYLKLNLLRRNTRRDIAFLVASVCCAAIAITHLAFAAWTVFATGREHALQTSLVHLVRGLIWAFSAVSLNVHPARWISNLVSVWWVSFAICITALNLKIVVTGHRLPILEAVSWAVNLMLLLCSIRVIINQSDRTATMGELSQPLLNEGTKTTGLSSASFFSKLTFSWLNPLLRRGYSEPMHISDIPNLDSEDGASLAHQTFIKEWDLQRKDRTNCSNLALLALARCYKKEMLLVGFYALLRALSVGTAPVLLYEFVQYSNNRNRNLHKGFTLVGCLLFIKVIESLSQRHWFFDSRRFGMRMRSALMAAVFQKLLKLSSPARRRHSTGEIVNYIAVDAYRLGEFPWWFHMAWSLPLQLLLSVAILFSTAGIGAIFGMIPLVICGLLNIPFAKLLQNCQHQFMIAQDKRLRATSEILNSMKIIKLQSWEEHFRKIIGTLRDEEFEWLKETQIKKSYGTALFWMAPTIISAVIFAGCVIMKSAPLNAGTIFTVLATLRVMSEPVRMLPEVLSVMIQVKVSLDRLDVFFLEDEIKEEDVNRSQFQNSEVCVEINRGVFCWDPQSSNLTLNDINLIINRRQKVAICGPVGAGKSSLLYAILGEIPKYSGSVDVYGSIAYVSQTSWIQSGTIQDNILYGKPMNKRRYEMVIKSCALAKDIENFDNGDLTEIGQRGLNMSGGQKQRIQLARGVFSDADIYLLDDPFSAVDAHTAAILFHDCVMNTLVEKTVILVTHQIEFLAEMDQILVMENGQVTQAGTYDELLASGAAFQQLVNAHQSSMTGIDSANNQRIKEARKSDGNLVGSNEYETVKQSKKGDISDKGASAIKLTEEEEKEIGDGGWKPYKSYIYVSKSIYHLSAIIFSQLAFVILQMSSTYWLAIGVQFIQVNNYVLVGAYTVISVVSCLFAYLRSWWAAHLGLRASKEFFSGLMNSVFKAPMLFFDSTPVGRILTRASSDLSILDFDIPFAISFVLAPSIELIFIILLMATVTWQVLVAAIPVQMAVIYLQRYYVASARELVRINGTTKAPIMNYTAETTLGVVTIRAFAVVERFIKNNIRLINTDAMLFFHTIGAMEWVLIRVEALQILTIVTATVLLILLPPDSIGPGFVGLSLSYALTLTTTQVFLTRWYSSLENCIISVERIKQYMHLSSEPPAIINDRRPPPSWPHEGKIDLQDLKIKYRPNAPLVLKGISCTFAAGHRIGVVGRTGSGKTTLISALFRLVEPAAGKILIDGVDICSIGLKDLRMKLSIIPQDPTLFKGTIRSNLDPLGLYSDSEIWEALEKCQLKTTVSSLPELLDSSVSDEGENWSVGQRQLFCLGRVLLRRNRILVLDEATASIDSATDAALQRIIREEFIDCTVITVAHRVPTVIDSDMVMVLSYGKLLEYNTPTNLMGSDSSFSKLVAEYWSNCKRTSSHNLGNV